MIAQEVYRAVDVTKLQNTLRKQLHNGGLKVDSGFDYAKHVGELQIYDADGKPDIRQYRLRLEVIPRK